MADMKRILAAVDASPRANHVLESATDLARRTGAKVALFRSVGLPPEIHSQFVTLGSASLLDQLLDKAREDLVAASKDVAPELLDGCFVRIGTPWDAICTEAKELDADLIVVGSHGYSGLDRVLGTTAAKVVNHADRPVLVVRPKPEKK